MPAPSESDIRAALVIGHPLELGDAATRSHLSDGRCVAWRGGLPGRADLVLDAELGDRQPPDRLGREFGHRDFWGRWTRAECAAKLTDRPIVDWIKEHGLSVPPGLMDVVTLRADWLAPGLVVSVAWRAQASSS